MKALAIFAAAAIIVTVAVAVLGIIIFREAALNMADIFLTALEP